MDKFNFLNLPLVVQEIIVEKMLLSLPIQDCFEFSKTSEYCLWLIQRVKSKKLDGKNFTSNYSEKSADDLDQLLSFVNFRTLRIFKGLFFSNSLKFFEKFNNSWISSVKNVKKLYIPSIKHYEEEFLKLLSSIDSLEELEIYEDIKAREVIFQILAKMKNVRSLYLRGPVDVEFLKLLASKTSPEKPLVKCYVRSSDLPFTVAAEEKFKQDVYCVEKDGIKFETERFMLILNWKTC